MMMMMMINEASALCDEACVCVGVVGTGPHSRHLAAPLPHYPQDAQGPPVVIVIIQMCFMSCIYMSHKHKTQKIGSSLPRIQGSAQVST